jgi:hypothetical protein
MRINQTTKQRVTDTQLKKLLPDVSFNADSDLSSFGYPTVVEVPRPPPRDGYNLKRSFEEVDGQWTMIWTEEPIDLEQYRATKHRHRQQALSEAQYSTFIYNGNTYDCDDNSRSLINGAVVLASVALGAGTQEALDDYTAALGAGWRDADGTPRITTAMEMIALGQALAAHIATTDAIGQVHKAAIDAATTVDELAAIDPTTGYL